MILVLAGTTEARSVIDPLLQKGYKVVATTFSKYGKTLLNDQDKLIVRDGRLDQDSFTGLIREKGIKAVIDATHPFAVNVSALAMTVCCRMELSYIRYERETTRLTEGQEVIITDNFTQAAERAAGYEGCVFLTVGVNNLEAFCRVISPERIAARVLPQLTSLEKCLTLGIAPANILAMQGPFSRELNRELYRRYQAGVVVTKDSGETGGVEEKLAAAADLGIPVVMVRRPILYYPIVVKDIEGLLRELERQL